MESGDGLLGAVVSIRAAEQQFDGKAYLSIVKSV